MYRLVNEFPGTENAFFEIKNSIFIRNCKWSHPFIKFIADKIAVEFFALNDDMAFELFKKVYKECSNIFLSGNYLDYNVLPAGECIQGEIQELANFPKIIVKTVNDTLAPGRDYILFPKSSKFMGDYNGVVEFESQFYLDINWTNIILPDGKMIALNNLSTEKTDRIKFNLKNCDSFKLNYSIFDENKNYNKNLSLQLDSINLDTLIYIFIAKNIVVPKELVTALEYEMV